MVYSGVIAAAYCSVYTECFTCLPALVYTVMRRHVGHTVLADMRGILYDMVYGCWLWGFGVPVYTQCCNSIYATACIRAG